MDKKQKLILYLGVFIVAILIFSVVDGSFKARDLRKELEITRPQLKKKDSELAKAIKNIDELRKEVEKREKYWESIQSSYRDSLQQSRKRTAAAIIRYEKLKNTPTPLWTVPELDSIKSTILHANR